MTLPLSSGDPARSEAPQPFFFPGSAGPLFCLLQAPPEGTAPRGALLYLPPFAEEANRSRRMAVLQARRLAARGWAVLLLDPYGTGDSSGGFHEARWEIWQADVEAAAAWLTTRWPGIAVSLWGLRLGALLAAEVAGRHPARFARLLLWQPVLRGDQFMSQFLRLRIAAAMAAGEKESGEALRGRLAAGETLEVAGYELAPPLVAAIESRRFDTLLPALSDCRIDWLEVTSAEGEPAPAPASQRLLEALPDDTAGRVNCRAVAGAPFWTIQEITLAPALLDATDARFE
ncbi:hydrolase 2, exosortase A system-associated [Pelagibius sp. 7325]|uniref:hydrolase 2, exosortase A system-associated n=1 Tax=Pelagibius sp. 7325 TaxID=3131994 RepID=UPI0030EDC9D1